MLAAIRYFAVLGLLTPLGAEPVLLTLKQKCFGCHGDGNIFGKLDLRTREAALRGGARGPAIVPGRASDSLLYKALLHQAGLKMPPGEDAKLPAETLDAFRLWIDGGAPYEPPKAGSVNWGNYREDDLWAFRALKKTTGSVDSFIAAELKRNSLSAAPLADRRTLLRRVTLDLTGLPPGPDDVKAFLKDPAAGSKAFAKVVDRLLASPQYGERWARHWLDVVRYADSNGYSNDYERPNAWRYRDYVIRAFNSDKPYSRFIEEQVAGDELFPDSPEAIIATGFLRAGPWEHTGMSVAAETRQMWLDDVTHSTANAFLGLTLGCSRCHDHKFDPLPTKDYYRMQAVFATTAFARRPLPFLETERRDSFEAAKTRMDALIAQTEVAIAGRKKNGLSPDEKEAVKLYSKHLAMHKESSFRYKPHAFAVSSGLEHEEWNDVGPEGARSYMKKPDYEFASVHVLVGGSLQSPGPMAEPGVLSALEQFGGYAAPEIPRTASGRRAALAKWIANPANPLTARVMVNRIWQYHFGGGLAENSNNFGKMGGKPTHPELLDWLASRFIESGWSVKAIHREILLSETYRRASGVTAANDPENRFLSHFSPRRVEAEVLRDAMLSVSGELSEARGGPGTFPRINTLVAHQPRHAMGTLRPVYWPSPTKEARNRRTIYTFQQRSIADPVIESFNGASMDMSCERRESTTVPTQAFSLLNSELSREIALAFAARISREGGDPVERAFQLAFQRPPNAGEKREALRHLAAMTEHHQRTPPASPPKLSLERSITSELTGEKHAFQESEPPWTYEPDVRPADVTPAVRALAGLALVLFNSNEFVYVY